MHIFSIDESVYATLGRKLWLPEVYSQQNIPAVLITGKK